MSKRFIPRVTASNEVADQSFQPEWPTLGKRHFSADYLEHLKDIEENVLKEAKERAQYIEKEAYEKGFAQGERDGLELGKKRAEAVAQQMNRLLDEMLAQRGFLYRTYEREMLQLVISICKKLIRSELRINETVILNTLHEIFQRVTDQRRVVLRLNPVDAEVLNRFDIFREKQDGQRLKIMKDPSISRGGCIVETPFGDIDATVETQIEQIVSVLWEKFEKALVHSEG